MSSFDKTMRFEFQEDPMEHDVKEVLLHVSELSRKKAIIRLTRLLAIYCLAIRPTFQDIRMHAISSESWSGTRSLKNW